MLYWTYYFYCRNYFFISHLTNCPLPLCHSRVTASHTAVPCSIPGRIAVIHFFLGLELRRIMDHNFNYQIMFQIYLGKSQISPQCIYYEGICTLVSDSTVGWGHYTWQFPWCLSIRVGQWRHRVSPSPFLTPHSSLMQSTEIKRLYTLIFDILS